MYPQADYNEYVVVVDADEVTEAERYNINKVTKRIRPQDAVITVVQRDEFFNSLILETRPDSDVPWQMSSRQAPCGRSSATSRGGPTGSTTLTTT